MSEPKLCSYCKSVPQANTWTLHGISETRYFCPNPECPHSVRTVTLEEWQTRPIEDELQAENERLKEELQHEKTRSQLNLEAEERRMLNITYYCAEIDRLNARIAELEGLEQSEITSCKFCGSNKLDRRMNSIVCADCGRKVGDIAPEVQE